MTFDTGRSMQCLGMAITTGCTAVINAAPTFIGNAGMWPVISCKPIVCRVTGCTVETKHASMENRIGMTTYTVRRETGELIVGVALFTRQPHMLSCKWEFGFVVIEGYIIPGSRLMTGSAIRPETADMFVILFMAGIAIGRRALVYIIDVALLAFHFRMFAIQLERGEIVIELRGCPASCSMAGGAIRTEPALVRIVTAMTGITIGRCILEIH